MCEHHHGLGCPGTRATAMGLRTGAKAGLNLSGMAWRTHGLFLPRTHARISRRLFCSTRVHQPMWHASAHERAAPDLMVRHACTRSAAMPLLSQSWERGGDDFFGQELACSDSRLWDCKDVGNVRAILQGARGGGKLLQDIFMPHLLAWSTGWPQVRED